MNLICPHCQKLVTVGEELAGQTTTCPQCRGPFTVPMPPRPAAAAPPPPPPPPPLTPAPEPLPPPSFTAAAEPTISVSPPPPPTGDYQKHFGFALQPRILRWIAPACFVLMFLLMFFPWVGIYYGSEPVARQIGFGVAFGITGPDKPASKEEEDSVAPFTLLLFLFLLAGVAAAAGLVVLTLAPHVVPPHIVQIAYTWRTLAVGGLSAALLFFVAMQTLMGFPLENRVLGKAEKERDAAIKNAKESDKAAVRHDAEIKYGAIENAVRHRTAFRLVGLLALIAVLSAAADLWLEKRPGRPLPRLTLEW